LASVLDAVRIDAASRFMRTTLDLPDAVARRAKLAALRRKKSTLFWCARSRRRMKLLSDVNVLLAPAAECHDRYAEVRRWWEGLHEDESPTYVGPCRWSCCA